MCLTHCHFTLCCNLSLCPAQGCFGAPDRRARGFTRMDTAVIASFALRWKVQRCTQQLLALFLELRCQSTTFASAAAVVATACCFFIVFHSCPTHVPLQSFPARSESLSLRCLNCVPVSHTCSGVLPVQVHPTEAIWRTTENLLFVLRYTMFIAQFLEFPFRQGIFIIKSASLLVPGIFRIVASRLWNTSCTHKPLCVHVSNLPCTQPWRRATSRHRICLRCVLGFKSHAHSATRSHVELQLSASQRDYCLCRRCCIDLMLSVIRCDACCGSSCRQAPCII